MRLIESSITQLKVQGPSRTCNRSKEEEDLRAQGEASGKSIQGLGLRVEGPGVCDFTRARLQENVTLDKDDTWLFVRSRAIFAAVGHPVVCNHEHALQFRLLLAFLSKPKTLKLQDHAEKWPEWEPSFMIAYRWVANSCETRRVFFKRISPGQAIDLKYCPTHTKSEPLADFLKERLQFPVETSI